MTEAQAVNTTGADFVDFAGRVTLGRTNMPSGPLNSMWDPRL
jgi:hypothetical protein